MKKKIAAVAVFLILFMFVLPKGTMAKGLFEHQNTIVPEQQSVENVAVIGGDATIFGTVKDTVVVLNGDLIVKSTGRIQGTAIVIGGKILQETGSDMPDEMIHLSFDETTQNSLLIGGGLVLSLWMLQLCLSAGLVAGSALLTLFIRQRAERYVSMLQQSPGHLLRAGLLFSLVLLACSILLALSLIGLPLVLLILLAVAGCFLFGFTIISLAVGDSFSWTNNKAVWIKGLTGSFLIIAVLHVPVLGWLLFLALTCMSIGMAAVWGLDYYKRRKPQ